MGQWHGKCAKCGGSIQMVDGVIKCTSCALEVDNPVRRKEWYKTNLEEMAKELAEGGNAVFLKRWPVKPQLISHIKASKEYRRLVPPSPAAIPKRDNHLPPLPPFSENWGDEVKVKWLEVYETLATKR
ncbi:MAG: hypothetical protein KKB38_20370 [Gammaproteobacteria bacterium]|nr:hypothetical protein [Gammaproteobacteria bacterium]